MASNNYIETQTVTIAASGTVSDIKPGKGLKLLGIRTPSAWTTANITIQGDFTNDSTFADVGAAAQDGSALTLTGAANKYYPLPTPVRAFRFKVTSSATQAAARAITLVFERQN